MIRDSWDQWLDLVIDIYRDRQRGTVEGWPESYSAAVVDAVRYLEQVERAAEADMWREQGG